jgi:hypothetical protein
MPLRGIKPMLVWYSAMMLAWEAAKVVETRLQMLARGACTTDEMLLMLSEKVKAMEEAKAIVTSGGHPELVIDNYRRIVAANAARLSR